MQAWKEEKGGKVYIGDASPEVHAVTGNYRHNKTNAAKVSAGPEKLKLTETESGKISASVKGEKPKYKALSHKKLPALRYYSSDRNVATVKDNGKVAAVGEGNCSIYAVAANGVLARVKVKVLSAPRSLAFGKSRYAVKKGRKLDLMALLKVKPEATKTTYYWQSSAPDVVGVNGKGVVKGLQRGRATITVTAANGKQAKVTVVVR